MTRSIDPILVSLAPYTAVPSTLSLPIREPVSLASVTIVAPPWLNNVATSGAKDCSCEQGLEECQRQEPSPPSQIYSIRGIVKSATSMRKSHLKGTLRRP